MKYAKVLLLIFIVFFAMVFFNQNNQALSTTVQLELTLFVKTWKSIPIPFYFLLLLGFLIGALFTLFYFFTDRIRLAKRLKQSRVQSAKLQEEVNSFRNMPLEKSLPGDETKIYSPEEPES